MRKVLLVDDEPIFRMGLRAGIQWESIGCKIVGEAKNGEEALLQIDEKKPDLVLLDIKMPKMDGIEVLKRMKNKEQVPQFIVLSCFNEYEYVREAMKLGACDYLFKPLMEGNDIKTAVWEIIKNLEESDEKIHEDKIVQVVELLNKLFLEKERFQDILPEIDEICSPLGKDSYFVLAVKIPGKVCTEQKKETLLALCKSILIRCFDDYGHTYFFEYNHVLYGLFFYGDEVEFAENVERKKLLKRIKEYVEVPVWIGSSRCMKQKEDLRKAYLEANRALKKHFFSSDIQTAEEFLEYRETPNENENFLVAYAEELEEISQAFGNADLKKIKEIIEKINYDIFKNEKFYEKEFSRMLANIIISNMRLYKHSELMEQMLMEDYDTISNLYHQETVKECCDYFFDILEKLFRSIKETDSGNVRADAVKKIVKYMEEHYAEKISLSEMAKKAYMSDKYFCKLFKEVTGETFVEHLTGIRVQAAVKLLTDTDLKTYHISEQCGFGDYHHFCKTFKKVTGKTPTEIRINAVK